MSHLSAALWQECGIGWQSEDAEGRAGAAAPEAGLDEAGAGHRVLVFAQLKGLLELVEADVLRPGGVSFLRLDGRYPFWRPLSFAGFASSIASDVG